MSALVAYKLIADAKETEPFYDGLHSIGGVGVGTRCEACSSRRKLPAQTPEVLPYNRVIIVGYKQKAKGKTS